jgi:membrane-bound ClpP family serine protease
MSTLAWPILLLGFGLILLIAEVFIPSGGAIGLLAIGCLVLSLWQAFRESFQLGLQFLLADFLLLPLTMAIAVYFWPKTPLAKRVFLKPPTTEELDVSHATERLDHLVGQFGRALTTLRPSGLVSLEGRRHDGLSEGVLIPEGALVQVVRVRSGTLVVRLGEFTAPSEQETFS